VLNDAGRIAQQFDHSSEPGEREPSLAIASPSGQSVVIGSYDWYVAKLGYDGGNFLGRLARCIPPETHRLYIVHPFSNCSVRVYNYNARRQTWDQLKAKVRDTVPDAARETNAYSKTCRLRT
jgi:hypothetical protein